MGRKPLPMGKDCKLISLINALLPREIILLIATFLDPVTGHRLRQTCAYLYAKLSNTYDRPSDVKVTKSPLLAGLGAFRIVFRKSSFSGTISCFAYICRENDQTTLLFSSRDMSTRISWKHKQKYAIYEPFYRTDEKQLIKETTYLITLKARDLIINNAKNMLSHTNRDPYTLDFWYSHTKKLNFDGKTYRRLFTPTMG